MRAGLIVGTGVDVSVLAGNIRSETVQTAYGEAALRIGNIAGYDITMVMRHGTGHTIPPHRINYRANVAALKQRDVDFVLATAAVGTLNENIAVGHFCVPDDFIDWTRNRPSTLYDGEDGQVIHTDFSEPYCPTLRAMLYEEAAKQDRVVVHERGCYACLDGPRYETPAEIRALKMLGADIVGMTNATEAILCREAGMCFATLALATNWAAGISPSQLQHDEVTAVVQENKNILTTVLQSVFARLHAEESMCDCAQT